MRIAIVNDVLLAIETVRRVVLSAPGHQIAWIARDGLEAVELCARDRPDLILMDLIMPRLSGVEATRRIMANTPCAIVIVTASVSGNSSKVFEAMGAGALDAVNTPVMEHPSAREAGAALLAKIETIHRIIGAGSGQKLFAPAQKVARPATLRDDFLVAIGASAGGPSALAKVLGPLSADFPAPIVVIQHVDTQFAQGLAEWLDSQTPLHVRLARQGDRPEPGTILLAGGNNHLVFTSPAHLGFTRQPVDCSYRPSIDVFFHSAARYWRGDLVAVLLTGMGRDGAEGLRALRGQRFHTIAQDAATSAVYGMPKAAAELNAASEILPLDRIGPRIVRLLSQRTRRHA
jgi:two-component system, chemotaxis family, response regulator WspF